MKIQFDFIADVLISATGESDVNAVYCDENVWLTQKMMGLLYNVETQDVYKRQPFMLGTLNAKIYNIDTKEYDVVKWNELENVQYFYNFFKKHEQEFEEVIHESGE